MTPAALKALILQKKSMLCVGLDPDPELLPSHLKSLPLAEAILEFNQNIIRATLPYAVAYKPNFAFYEALGPEGYSVLKKTLECIPPEIFVIADAKRGDIGNTSLKYARAVWDLPGTDAITVAPYMGKDSVLPFLQAQGKWVFILALTSNTGAQDFQFLEVEGKPLYEKVMRTALEWQGEAAGNIGFVTGATQVSAFTHLRNIAPESFFLVPGIGAQGGDLESVCKHLGPLALINVGRQIMYASSEKNYAEAARDEAAYMQKHMEAYCK